MSKRRHLTAVFLAIFLLLGGMFSVAPHVFAQDEVGEISVDTGLEGVQEASGLSDTDIRLTIGRIIQVFMATLGVVFLILVIYAGYLWMTAGGNPERVERAKKFLINGVIGMIIAFSSLSIATFVISSLLDATGAGGPGEFTDLNTGPGLGGSDIDSFAVADFIPVGEVPIRNILVQILFTKYLDADIPDEDLSDYVEISYVDDGASHSAGDVVTGTYEHISNRITFRPDAECPGYEGEGIYCFDENTPYLITVSPSLLDTRGSELSCDIGEGCSSLFTSGDIIDLEDPDVTITDPEDRVQIGFDQFVQAHVTDDYGIASASFAIDEEDPFDIVGAPEDVIMVDAYIETIWYTDDLIDNEFYLLETIATDYAGNQDSDSVRVKAIPAHCYDGVFDEEVEEFLDCGIDCPSCGGAECVVDLDCAGICVDGRCVANPVIRDVSPLSGGPGTFVTISGENFGFAEGFVRFQGLEGPIDVVPIACSLGWQHDQVIVAVPEGAILGSLELETVGGLIDTTFGDIGPDFIYDPIGPIGVNLCGVFPDEVDATDTIALQGENFFDVQGDSVVLFDDIAADTYPLWSDDVINAVVPNLAADVYPVRVQRGDTLSNPANLTVRAPELLEPVITDISPAAAAMSDYVTLTGIDFGRLTGVVWFENTGNGDLTPADIDFPEICSDGFWEDQSITVIVPDGLEFRDHNVFVETVDGTISNSVDFLVEDRLPGPGLCAIDPDREDIGAAVSLHGDRLGGSDGTVSFYSDAGAEVIRWEDGQVDVKVPVGAITGPVTAARPDGIASNPIQFEVGPVDGGDEGGDVSSAQYLWQFSTGDIPDAPSVYSVCNDERVSAVPNNRYSDDICVNSVVYAVFDTWMDRNSISLDAGGGGSVYLEHCLNDDCSDTVKLNGNLRASHALGTTSITIEPRDNGQRFSPNTTYQVVITTGVVSEDDGTPLASDFSWQFTTRDSSADCDVERVRVEPSSLTMTNRDDSAEFQALPMGGDCTILRSADYGWSWDLDYSLASSEFSCIDFSDRSCIVVEPTGEREGETDVIATVDSGQQGVSHLSINYTDPYISQQWPNCSTACVNAAIGASFNTPMNLTPGPLPAVTDDGMAKLYACESEFCVNLGEPILTSVLCLEEELGGCTQIEFDVSAIDLRMLTYYRVVLSGSMVSASGVPLTRLNYGADYSWTFLTREDNAICTVSRIDISPEIAMAHEVGETQVFLSTPFGEPDSCSVAGQKLDGYAYPWSWEDPIISDAGVAEWSKTTGTLLDVNLSSIPAGCSGICTPIGSQAYAAVCGDGFVDTSNGEECESGDFCGADCLFVGNATCLARCGGSGSSCLVDADCSDDPAGATCDIVGGGCCGDGVLDESVEECDDSNIFDGDGCSASCLNEGSFLVSPPFGPLTCGDRVVSHDPAIGGEDCDDGGIVNGDGCSSSCLNEGSPSEIDIRARCGNGVAEVPYETCDDGNGLNGDGCSSQCLKEGGVTFPLLCGDGFVDAFEDCDGGEGCSDYCLFEGSSLTYSEISVCGDGQVGPGEHLACELGGGDGLIDPLQLAKISLDAGRLVDVESHIATATIQAQYEDLLSTAAFNLSCVAETDVDCDAGLGVDNNKCCSPRPEAVFMPNGLNSCRNASVYVAFDQEMNLESFRGEAKVLYVGDGACPAGHGDVFASSASEGGWLKRTLKRFFSWALSPVIAQEAGCYLTLRSFSQDYIDDGSDHPYRVSFHYDSLLVDGLGDVKSDYEIILTDAIESSSGVHYAPLLDAPDFGTSSEVCTISGIDVNDTNEDSPYFFTTFNEVHSFVASAYSLSTGAKQLIEPVDVYSWEWLRDEDTAWRSDNEVIAAAVQHEAEDEGYQAEVNSFQLNGTASITAEATVTDNTLGLETVSSVFGVADIVVNLCENPWPTISPYKFIDNEDGRFVGASELPGGSMNFSTYYCRDLPGEDLFGAANVLPESGVIVAESESVGVLKEYIYSIGETGDAVGIRIASNPEYLSPLAWYTSQGFGGSPTTTDVNGYAAVQDGRTVYVGAPNVNGDSIYANIYVISYNQGAGAEAIDIYNQMLNNFEFAVHLDGVNLCIGESLTGTICTSNLDCNLGDGEVCGSDRDKIRRDTMRLSDLKTIEGALSSYARSTKLCSATSSQICSGDEDCPGGEYCRESYPSLPSGTFIRSIDASTWASWDELLGASLGAIPSDPVNAYSDCGDLDSETCVNSERGEYMCPVGSLAYHYRGYDEFGYQVAAELEYQNEFAAWATPIDLDSRDGILVQAGGLASTKDFSEDRMPDGGGFSISAAFCNGALYGDSSLCGDGIIGRNEGGEIEVCEPGDASPDLVACELADGTVGTRAQTCNQFCTGYIDNPSNPCVPNICGNGVIDPLEECDDGPLNGTYGYCSASCSYEDAFVCGDDSLAGGEACDCGASGDGLGADFGGSACGVANGEYQNSPNDSCAWDCSGPADYCGDGIVTNGEQCDGDRDLYDGKLCYGGDEDGFPCSSDDDCSEGGGVCGAGAAYEACPESTICIAGTAGKLGKPCGEDVDCGTDGVCSDFVSPTTRTRTCQDDWTEPSSCQWTTRSWATLGCYGLGSCGDGVLDAGEQCDDGNDNPSDDCTNVCSVNICGDGFVNEGVELCDEGGNNGLLCDAPYGSSCNYCSLDCRVLYSSGAFCGDGSANGPEYCDGADLEATNGICNGGGRPGASCTAGGFGCTDGGVCELAICAPDCENSCPTPDGRAILTGDIQLRGNQVGSVRGSSVDLVSHDPDSAPDGDIIGASDAATLFIPACRVATTITADVAFNFEEEKTNIVFVTDLSSSMTGDRIIATKDALHGAGDSLYEAMGSQVSIGTIGYVSDSSCYGGEVAFGGGSVGDVVVGGFWGEASRSSYETEISSYTECGGTYTYSGLQAAKYMMDDEEIGPEDNAIIVLMTDGIWSTSLSGDAHRNPAFWACQIKYPNYPGDTTDGYELYTVRVGKTTESAEASISYEGWDEYTDQNPVSLDGIEFEWRDIFSDGEECLEFVDPETDTYDETWEAYEERIGVGLDEGDGGDIGEDPGPDPDPDLDLCNCLADPIAPECTDECGDGGREEGGPDEGGRDDEAEDEGAFGLMRIDFLQTKNNLFTFLRTGLSRVLALTSHTPTAFATPKCDAIANPGYAYDLYEDGDGRDQTDRFLHGKLLELACWSSGNINTDNQIDYAYNGSTAGEISDMYNVVIDSILGATFTFIDDLVDPTSQPVREGDDVELPFPQGFACDGENEISVPLQVTFDATEEDATITVSDVKFNYCAP
jgi:cysteine-rich repeat protein